MSLSNRVIELQQQLSEQFGIPTFTTGGGISTVPTTKTLSDINVGTGKFTGETIQSFNQKLKNEISKLSSVGGQIGNTVFSPPSQAPAGEGAKPRTPDTSSTSTDNIIESLEQLKSFLGPLGIGAVALFAFLAVRK